MKTKKLSKTEIKAAAFFVESFSPVRDRFRKRLVDRVVKQTGVKREKAEKAVDSALDSFTEADTGRPILDWLMNGGFDQLLALILKILALFPK